jgi:tetratricopeptide (TPR) repeat protein
MRNGSHVDDVLNAQFSILNSIEALVDKSLLRQVAGPGGDPRFVMLETIREYAIELQEQADAEEAEELRRRRASFYLELVERAERGFMGREQRLWLDRLEAEHDNIRAVMQWALERQEAETALLLCAMLSQFWWMRGYLEEARRWGEAALALPGAKAPTATRAAALTGLLSILWQQDDVGMAIKYGEESVAIWRALGEPMGRTVSRSVLSGPALALIYLGAAYWYQHDHDRARRLTEEGMEILRRQGDKWLLGVGLLDFGLAANAQGDYATARTALEESMGLFRAVGDKWGLTQVLNILGDLARIDGDYARAKGLYEESLEAYRELNIRVDIPASLHNLGYVALALGDIERAWELFVEALNLQRELANRQGIIECLSGLAGVAGAKGEAERAARLFGATTALREAISAPFWPAERADHDRNLAIARAQLDEAAWERAWAEGQAMSMEQAIEDALEDRDE